MTAAATTPLADRQIALLDELSQIGMTAARAIGRQITAIAPDETPAAPEVIAALESLTRAYSKIARATRLTVQLQDKIARPTGQSAEHAREPITHIVRTIVDPRQPGSEAESATRESRERLDRESDPAPTDLIAHICQDLGLDLEWSRRAAECWEHSESISEAPGWPLTQLAAHDSDAEHSPPKPTPRSPSPLAGEGVSAADG